MIDKIDTQIQLVSTKNVLAINASDELIQKLEKNNCSVTIIDWKNYTEIKQIHNSKFETILLGDNIDFVENLENFFLELKKLLTIDGQIIFSADNITHIENKIHFLNDSLIHLEGLNLKKSYHLFNLDSILQLVSKSGFEINKLIRIKQPLDVNSSYFKNFRFPGDLLLAINRDVNATTKSFIFLIKINNDAISFDWLSEFPNTIVTDRLEELFSYYKEEQFVIDRNNYFKTLEKRLSMLQETTSNIELRRKLPSIIQNCINKIIKNFKNSLKSK